MRANVRTTQAATESLDKALDISFKSGAITGFFVVGLGLLRMISYYLYLNFHLGETEGRKIIEAMVALSFGASLYQSLRGWVEEYLLKGLMLVQT